MSSTSSDRIDGLSTSVAMKAPVRVATTANITLSGEQTIDGVAVVTDDRVLVKDQTDGTENGIYVVKTTTWVRTKDFNGARDVRKGTILYVTDGTTGTGYYRVTTNNPITIGTSSLSFSKVRIADIDNLLTPESFGAIGDGVADDTTALQDAADAQRPIFFSPGVYRTTSEIVFKNGTKFIGSGWWGGAAGSPDSSMDTIIRYDGTTSTTAAVLRVAAEPVGTEPVTAATRDMRGCGVERMVVDANNKAGYGVYAIRTGQCNFDYVLCHQATEHCFYGAVIFSATMSNVRGRNGRKNGITIGKNIFGWSSAAVNNLTMIQCSGINCGLDETFDESTNKEEGLGLALYLNRGNTIISAGAEFCDGPGIFVKAESFANLFVGGYTEANGSASSTARATDAWDVWVESVASSQVLNFNGMVIRDAVKLSGTEPSGSGFTPVEFHNCWINGNIDADWDNYKLTDTRFDGTFSGTAPITTLMGVIRDGTVTFDPRAQGVAAAWGKITGTGTPAVTKGFNIASISDNGTGDYWVNFTRNMSSAEYAVSCSGNNLIVGVQSQEVSRVRINVRDNAGTLTDGIFHLVVYHDD